MREQINFRLVKLKHQIILLFGLPQMSFIRRIKLWLLIWVQVFGWVMLFSVWLLPTVFVGWLDLDVTLQICIGTLLSTFVIEFISMRPIMWLAHKYNFVKPELE
jgi:hypothetical protein